MVLTKAGSILGPIATVLGYVMDILFRFTSSFGVFNVGLCIILFTIVMKTLMIPLTIKQQKTTKLMSVMNPEIQAIQKKYKGKSDQESMHNVVTPLMGQADYAQKLQEITNIATACGGKLDKFDFTNANRLVDMLYKFSTSQWGELQSLFPAISDVIGQNAAVVERMNTFLGLNMAEAPGWVPSFAWIIPVLAAVSQWFSTKLMSGNQPSTSADAENPMAQSMKTMTTTMPLFSAFICITMPAGLGIYWIATSVVTIIQQLIVNAYMDKVNIDDMIAKNLEKVNKKRAKQGLPPAKVTQNATASLKAIKAEEEKEKAAEEVKKEKIAKQIEESSKYYNTNAKPGSLASKAAMVQKYNEAHDKRK